MDIKELLIRASDRDIISLPDDVNTPEDFSNWIDGLPMNIMDEIIRAVCPDFFGWGGEKQNEYRINTPEKDDEAIREKLYRKLFDLDASDEDIDLTPDQSLIYNKESLKFHGLGASLFFLNEHMGKESLLDFKTWFNYDKNDHAYQESNGENPITVVSEYKGTIYSRWARMLVDGEFFYVTLNTKFGYIYSALDSVSHDVISELIPYEFKEGPNNGRKVKGGFEWDYFQDANGKEKELTELTKKSYEYINKRLEYLKELCFINDDSEIYMIDITEKDNDPSMDIVASGPKVMGKINFLTFFEDCKKHKVSNDRLLEETKKEVALFKNYLIKESERLLL